MLRDPRAAALIEAHSRTRVADAIRTQLDDERRYILENGHETRPFSPDIFFEALHRRLAADSRPSLRRVINATGTVLHTNLGRAPLAQEALDALAEAAAGYADLEYDLTTGARGSRYAHVEEILRRLTGAEAALPVNNNAAAVTLAVNTFAKDGEVVTSRGE
ncbi:MAG: L-seryl-tRNA(Sec) selenium transferase, partial [Gammaproteobacteria bacterium]|nr:L-seryl-tRNA(Sec) selenium transferase [Gammaproteobacteria bacterium]NIR85581.1 L-seryl-tRNA(Sec) selenium transferase [Gammaproteobacteria bacterium]NIU06708.1 L-seryl-tRNA(Sec) selenium transferase [Gammaproteobacteria bacterium]NIX87981.1 L-seryl-tRNA(Sec) selenium transferase [Gammaproteobacteria bacterium]